MKKGLLILLSMVLILTLSASGVMAEVKPLRAAVMVCNMAHPFFMAMVDGAKDAGKKFNVEVTIYDGRGDPEVQTRQTEDAVVMKFDTILLNPIDVEALVVAVKAANRGGIPVFTLDRDVIGGERVAYIGTDNVKAAEEGAKSLIRFLATVKRPKPWRIVHLWGTPGASSAIERSKGVHNILDPLIKTRDIELVADLTANFDRATGMKVMEDILATTRKIDAVITGNDEMALGALEGLKAAGLKVGLPGGVLIFGFDAIDDAVKAVERGDFVATVAQAPYVMGYWGVQAMVKYIREGWKPPAGTPVYPPTGALHLNTPAVVVVPLPDMVAAITKTPPSLPE